MPKRSKAETSPEADEHTNSCVMGDHAKSGHFRGRNIFNSGEVGMILEQVLWLYFQLGQKVRKGTPREGQSEPGNAAEMQSTSRNGKLYLLWSIQFFEGQIKGLDMALTSQLLRVDLILRKEGGQNQKGALLPMPVRAERGSKTHKGASETTVREAEGLKSHLSSFQNSTRFTCNFPAHQAFSLWALASSIPST